MERRAPPLIFSPARRLARWQRAVAYQGRRVAAHFLPEAMVEDVLDRLAFMRVQPQRVLVLGDFTGALANSLAAQGCAVTAPTLAAWDEEAPYPAGGFDLIASLGLMDTLNDLPGALIHMRRALAPGGLAIASFPGAGSLPHLRAALLAADGERPAARMQPMVDTAGGAELMQRAGFARQVVDSQPLRASYASLDRLVADLRDQGLTNVLASAPPPLSREALRLARAAFLQGADTEGRITETFEILTLTGWA